MAVPRSAPPRSAAVAVPRPPAPPPAPSIFVDITAKLDATTAWNGPIFHGGATKVVGGAERRRPRALWMLVRFVHRGPLSRAVSGRRRRRWSCEHLQARQAACPRPTPPSRSPFPRQRSGRSGTHHRASAAYEVQEIVPGCVRGRDVRRHAGANGPGGHVMGAAGGCDRRSGRGAAPSRTLVCAAGGREDHRCLLRRRPAVGPGSAHSAAAPRVSAGALGRAARNPLYICGQDRS